MHEVAVASTSRDTRASQPNRCLPKGQDCPQFRPGSPTRYTPTVSRIALVASFLFAVIAFALGIHWGLPSRAADPFLFGQRAPWTGEQIRKLIGDRATAGLGADVDRDPLISRDGPVWLNETDAQRAAIVLRYRLYSAQPDEMITFMSLAGMQPSRFELDPKLYQYGGLWIYGVAAIIGATLNPTANLEHYLDHPEQFARFYIAARVYSAMFGLVGAGAVAWILKRLTASSVAAAIGVLCYALLPVVNNMAHEAKPHLPAAALMLLACVAGMKFVETARARWWVLTAILCGGSVSMILSAWPIVVVVPAMLCCRAISWRQRAVIATASAVIALDVYFLCNPYVLKHLLAWNSPENPLRSNLANSKAMYTAALSLGSISDAARLLGYAASGVVVILGFIGALFLSFNAAKRRVADGPTSQPRLGVAVILLGAPAAIILIQFTLLADGKPGEFARFALFPAVVLLIFAIGGVWNMAGWPAARAIVLFLLVGRVAVGGISYVWHFLRDSGERPTRLIVAERMEAARQRGARSVGLHAEPAPYSAPPMNLWDWELWYSPWRAVGRSQPCDIWLDAVDAYPDTSGWRAPPGGPVFLEWIRPRLLPTPISWAAKPFSVRGQARLLDAPAEQAR